MKYLEHLNSNYIGKTINYYLLLFKFFEKVNQPTINSSSSTGGGPHSTLFEQGQIMTAA